MAKAKLSCMMSGQKMTDGEGRGIDIETGIGTGIDLDTVTT